MKFLELAQSRYTSKAYDPSKKIPAAQLQDLLEVLRLTPSSINIQPWQFLVAQSLSAKQRIAEAMPEGNSYNIPKVLNASEVIVFCAKTDIDDAHLQKIIASEDAAGRFATPADKSNRFNITQFYVDQYRAKDMARWIDSQLHIALGGLLFAAAAEQIDATPIGGFSSELLDQNLDLSSRGLRSVVLVALGYHSAEDFNAGLDKARLSSADVIQFL
jgi:nitroreductase/dihydropteridine reductase